MARINDSNAPQMIKQNIQRAPSQGNSFPTLTTTNPIKAQEPSNRAGNQSRIEKSFFRNLSVNLFYIQFFLISVLIIFLAIRGLISSAHTHHFHPLKFYPPLLSSISCAAIISLTWQYFIRFSPSRTIKAAFWLGPLLTCAMGILLIAIGTAPSLALAAISLVSSIIQSLYACWVSRRFNHTIRIFSISLTFPPKKTTTTIFLTITASTLYSAFIITGIGGATATKTVFDAISIFVILLCLTWTMHIIKNTLQVTFSRVKYSHFAHNADFDTKISFRDMISHSMGPICIGSVLVPILGLIRGSARTINLISGDVDEFMFSCAYCYSGVASRLIMCGNRWGFVYVGVYNQGFVQASSKTWEMFRRVGLEPVIDTDLTSSFCFLCGMAGGSVCALVGGSWALVVHKNYATEICIYAFLIGYFMCRIAMAWPQASVSAYHVAYAENPQSNLFDSTIPDRIRELQRYQTQHTETTHSTEF